MTSTRVGGTTGISTRRKATNVAFGAVQIVAGVGLLASGVLKLAGAAPMVELFDAIGAGQWLRYVTGALEVIGATAMLTRRFAGYGALLLVGVLVGAVLAELLLLSGAWARPLPFLVAAAVVAWARRDSIRIGGLPS
ncbi:MAG: DoxX family protein [Egibacteraceae bacterium]